MEKEVGQIKVYETDSGFRVDVTGKTLKDLCSCGCVQIAVKGDSEKSDCCSSGEEKK